MDITKRFSMYAFEMTATKDGVYTWSEDELMSTLGYETRTAFRKAVHKAMQACLTMNVSPLDDFIKDGDGFRFTRFACYLVVMSCDTRKPRVAQVQFQFAALADVIPDPRIQAARVDRVIIREEVTDGMKSLSATAQNHGVVDYARFMDAGYRGMYNRSLAELERLKGIRPGEQLLDRMDRTELAANLFRITQTDRKIENENVHGQAALENAASEVGAVVRKAMIDLNNTAPEQLPIAEHIDVAKKKLKTARKELKKLNATKERDELLFKVVEERDLVDEESLGDGPGYTPDPEEDSE
ncbi:BRO family protein [Sorangium sp. So ce363]|uniref:BRO family protein n=1 Tax=Sorangium sp. So ce363 TaxID=3133304 RepID=UPI003F5F494F